MPRVEIQSCIRRFHVYKATVVFSSGTSFLYGPPLFVFISTSSVTCLLVASIQSIWTKDYGDSVDTNICFLKTS